MRNAWRTLAMDPRSSIFMEATMSRRNSEASFFWWWDIYAGWYWEIWFTSFFMFYWEILGFTMFHLTLSPNILQRRSNNRPAPNLRDPKKANPGCCMPQPQRRSVSTFVFSAHSVGRWAADIIGRDWDRSGQVFECLVIQQGAEWRAPIGEIRVICDVMIMGGISAWSWNTILHNTMGHGDIIGMSLVV